VGIVNDHMVRVRDSEGAHLVCKFGWCWEHVRVFGGSGIRAGDAVDGEETGVFEMAFAVFLW